MSAKFSFRRATHNLAGEYVASLASEIAARRDRFAVDPLHWMECNRGMKFDEIASAMQNDRTNFLAKGETPAESWAECAYPETEQIAIGLVAMLEHGLAEIVPAGWVNEARK